MKKYKQTEETICTLLINYITFEAYIIIIVNKDGHHEQYPNVIELKTSEVWNKLRNQEYSESQEGCLLSSNGYL